MREIKFRLYNKLNQKLYDVDILEIPELLLNWSNIIFCQYTGLKDKNGIEVYEGDIIKWECIGRRKKQNGISKIIWQNAGFEIDGSDFGYEGEDLISWENLTVIGNIYENSELLKQ